MATLMHHHDGADRLQYFVESSAGLVLTVIRRVCAGWHAAAQARRARREDLRMLEVAMHAPALMSELQTIRGRDR